MRPKGDKPSSSRAKGKTALARDRQTATLQDSASDPTAGPTPAPTPEPVLEPVAEYRLSGSDPHPNSPDISPQTGTAPAASAGSLADQIQAELSEMRGAMLRFVRRLDARAETPEGQEDLPRLSTAMVKVARAHRQISVLQLETAGERPLPQARGTAVMGAARRVAEGAARAVDGAMRSNHPDAANPDRTPLERDPERYVDGYPFMHGDYTEYDDYSDEEKAECRLRRLGSVLHAMCDEMDKDFIAADAPELVRQSPKVKVKMILGIPHPALDEFLKTVDPHDVIHLFGEDVLPLQLGPGPPGKWERHREMMAGMSPRERERERKIPDYYRPRAG